MIALAAALWPAAAHAAQNPIYYLSNLHLNSGDFLHVAPNATVFMDMEPSPNLGGVLVEGSLIFVTTLAKPELRAAWILVGTSDPNYTPQIKIGSSSAPTPSACTAKITLLGGAFSALDSTSSVLLVEPGTSSGDVDARAMLAGALSDRGLVVYEKGKLLAFGEDQGVSWSSLAAKAAASSSTITVSDTGLGVWDEKQIVISSTDFAATQAQEVKVNSIATNGTNSAWTDLTLNASVTVDHYALAYAPTTHSSEEDWTVYEKAEVGLLTRNVVIQVENLVSGNWVPGSGSHGHVMICRNESDANAVLPVARVSWVQFLNLGIVGKIKRYPLHFHYAGTQSTLSYPSYVMECSFTHCFNKFLSIHNTQNMDVKWNVGYDTIGNGFYLEDETTTGIVMQYNLGLGTRAITAEEWGSAPTGERVSDADREPAVFWHVSPDNSISFNRAAGSSDYGFWYSPLADEAFLINGGSSRFEDNIAHSNGQHGFYQDKVATDANTPPRAKPWYTSQPQMRRCTAYKNRRYGIWVRSYGRVFLDSLKVADNRSGYYFASDGFQGVIAGPSSDLRTLSRITLSNSLAIGETSNLGTPGSGTGYSHESDAGRSLPQPVIHWDGDRQHDLAWASLTGIDIYDGLLELNGVRFADFQSITGLRFPDNSGEEDRRAAAISQVAYDSQYMADPRNRAQNLSFANVGSNVAFRYPSAAVSGANMIKNTIVFDVSGGIMGSGYGQGYLLALDEPFLNYNLPSGTTAFTSVRVRHVPVGLVDYASLVIETGGSPVDMVWAKMTHAGTGSTAFQKVHEVNSQDRFPLAVIMNREYVLDYLDGSTNPVSLSQANRPRVVDLNLRFAVQTGQYIIVAVPWWRSTVPSVHKVNLEDMVVKAGLSELRSANNTDNSYYWDSAASTIYVKIFTALKSGSVDLLATGTEQLCRIDQ